MSSLIAELYLFGISFGIVIVIIIINAIVIHIIIMHNHATNCLAGNVAVCLICNPKQPSRAVKE